MATDAPPAGVAPRSAGERFPADHPFSYACNRCRRCCSGKRIRVNPYEIYRLARNRGMSTTGFRAAHTVEGGTELARRDDGTCVFLGAHGCEVHADRPLVCRLYPLGRAVVSGEPDRYFHLEPHPGTEGAYGEAGVVADYLAAQGAGPFLAAADRYLAFVTELAATMAALAANDEEDGAAMRTALAAPAPDGPEAAWLDIDLVLAHAGHEAPPADAEEALTWHLTALHAWRRLTPTEGGTA